MRMVIQHNMQAMNTDRMLCITGDAQAKSSEKLSSGYRINRAADDAAGLSISEKMRKQIRGLDRASMNAENGISAVQTAEGALTEVHSMLHRMNELAVQAANEINSESDRAAIQDEIDQMTTEIDRVAETTQFNGINLLKGSSGTKIIDLVAHDAGLKGKLIYNGGGTALFEMDKLSLGDEVVIGGKQYVIGSSVNEARSFVLTRRTGIVDITIGGKTFKLDGRNVLDVNGNRLYVKTADGESDAAEFDRPDVEFTTSATFKKDDPVNGMESANNPVVIQNLAAHYIQPGTTVKVGNTSITVMVDKINGLADGIDDNDVTLITRNKAYQFARQELLAANQIGDTEHSAEVHADALKQNQFIIRTGQAKVANGLEFNLHVGADADVSNKIGVSIETMNVSYLRIKGLNVKDATGMAATYAIDAITDAVAKVSAQRSLLGAIQNRLEHTIKNVDNVVENTTSAESRIRDTDMAKEMVGYSKNNILAQAGQSMLASANQSNQGVLSLLS